MSRYRLTTTSLETVRSTTNEDLTFRTVTHSYMWTRRSEHRQSFSTTARRKLIHPQWVCAIYYLKFYSITKVVTQLTKSNEHETYPRIPASDNGNILFFYDLECLLFLYRSSLEFFYIDLTSRILCVILICFLMFQWSSRTSCDAHWRKTFRLFIMRRTIQSKSS